MTIREVLQLGTERLKAAGLEDPRLEAEILLGWVMGMNRPGLYLNSREIVQKPQLKRFKRALDQRARRKPWQYITGQTEFHGLRLRIDKSVLIPRPETELLAEQVISRWRKEWTKALDIGTGSGALALALASEIKDIRITASDCSTGALRTARNNAMSLGLASKIKFVKADLFPRGRARYDFIVSNPPYIPSRQIDDLQPEVSDYEPRQALDGGRDGLDFYRRISKRLADRLNPGGLLALEVGKGQAGKVCSMLRKENLGLLTEIMKDYAGINRMVFAYRAKKGLPY